MCQPPKPPGPVPSVEKGASSADTSLPGKSANTAPPEIMEARTLTRAPANEATAPLSAALPSLEGTTFGDFEILKEIGRGGMGVVYKARQVSLDRPVAVKMLLGDHFRNPVLLQRFLAEARAAAALAHPNIVAVYQVGECPAGHYFVMEYIDGQTLEELIGKHTIPIPWAVNLLITVAEAVHFAHTKGIIHRDLKPGNIMIDKLRRPVVMDFGIAKVTGKSSGLTLHGAVMGTPAYMPPEQAGEETPRIGPHSDVYSLGAILYTMLTSQVLYDEGTALRTIMKVVSPEPAPSPRALRSDVPSGLERICLKCLSKQPAERYQTAQALAEDLRRFRAGQAPVAARKKEPAEPVSLDEPKADSAVDLRSLDDPKKSRPAELDTLRTYRPTVLLVAEATGKQVRLSQTNTVIGRASESDLIVKASSVSKRHCQVIIQADQVVVEDLGSSNGISVNGRRVGRSTLQDGDQLDIGGHLFRVRVQAPKE